MTGSDTMPLLDHELAHVVQQDRAAGTSHSVGVLQRAGLDEPIVQAPSASASSAPENQAAGLPEPDCNTRVADLFLLGAISCPQRSECFAQIHDRKNRNLTGIFRADHQLEGRPDCEYRGPKTPRFLAGESVADCRDHDVGADGDEHVRARGNVGCGRDRHGQGESRISATVPARAPSSASLPPHIVDHTQGMWGKSHKIHYDDQCNGVHFVPNEPGKETKGVSLGRGAAELCQ